MNRKIISYDTYQVFFTINFESDSVANKLKTISGISISNFFKTRNGISISNYLKTSNGISKAIGWHFCNCPDDRNKRSDDYRNSRNVQGGENTLRHHEPNFTANKFKTEIEAVKEGQK